MTYDTEHYYAVQTFLEDDELYQDMEHYRNCNEQRGYDVSNQNFQ